MSTNLDVSSQKKSSSFLLLANYIERLLYGDRYKNSEENKTDLSWKSVELKVPWGSVLKCPKAKRLYWMKPSPLSTISEYQPNGTQSS